MATSGWIGDVREPQRRYDLGGVDAKRNPGVFEFKKRMRGTLMELPAKRLLIGRLGFDHSNHEAADSR